MIITVRELDLFGDFAIPEVVGELFADAAFFLGVFGDVPAEGLVEEVAVQIEGGFDDGGVDFGGVEGPAVGKGEGDRGDRDGPPGPKCPD